MKTKLYAIDNERFAALPVDVQERAKSICRVYDRANITFEYGKYTVSSAIGIKSVYAPDHEFIGCAYAEDIFTPEERILNYINEFQCYPPEYKGKRDYSVFHTGKRETFVFDNDGNLVIAE